MLSTQDLIIIFKLTFGNQGLYSLKRIINIRYLHVLLSFSTPFPPLPPRSWLLITRNETNSKCILLPEPN